MPKAQAQKSQEAYFRNTDLRTAHHSVLGRRATTQDFELIVKQLYVYLWQHSADPLTKLCASFVEELLSVCAILYAKYHVIHLPFSANAEIACHDDVIKWKHFPRHWLFVRGIHRSPVNSTHKGQWGGALMLSLPCARINGWANSGDAGDLRRDHAHYDVIVMCCKIISKASVY